MGLRFFRARAAVLATLQMANISSDLVERAVRILCEAAPLLTLLDARKALATAMALADADGGRDQLRARIAYARGRHAVREAQAPARRGIH